jgi:hypothetical protein
MSNWRCVQRGEGPAVLLYLVGLSPPLEAAMKAALPGVPIAATGDSGYGAPASDIAAGLKACGGSVLVALGGYSAGCQGVRQQLWNGAKPQVVLTVDGTAGPWPLADNTRELQVWRDLIADCRSGAGRTFIATCTMQRYTQRLKATPTQKQGPFAATSTVLARVLDWPELDAAKPSAKQLVTYPGPAILEKHEVGVHVLAYGGTDCDNPAHSAQLTKVLPELLATYVAPALGVGVDVAAVLAPFRGFADAVAKVAHSIADLFGNERDPSGTPAEQHLARAMAELGVAEIPGAASNPRIDEYLAVARRGGKPLGLRGDDQFSWCAAFFSWSGLPPDMTPCAAVAEMVTQAKATGRWRPADVFHSPKPGDAAIFKRSGGDPRTGGLGHIARVEIPPNAAGVYVTVDGNSDNKVQRNTRRLDDPTLIGWVVYDV